MFIVVGLGNPGREYARTRHNVGFDVIDVLSEKHHIQLTKNAMHGQIGEGFVGGEKLVLVKPQTFMNLSGQCVTELVSWYKPEMDHLMVVYDDIDLPLGKLRTRDTGSVVTLTIASLLDEKVIVPARMSLLTRKYSPSMACNGSRRRGNSLRAST